MALINCSECGKQVSDRAEKCPHCGNPIKITNILPSSYQNVSNIHGKDEGCFLQTLNLGCVVTVVIIIIFLLFIFFGISSH